MPSIFETRIYDVNSISFQGNPTHLRTSFQDEIRKQAVVKTVYTGIINIGHGAEDQGTSIDFRYPLLGFFEEKNGMLTLGIIPIEENKFIGAAAMAALSNAAIKDTVGACSVMNVS